jgi:hypothetical protein
VVVGPVVHRARTKKAMRELVNGNPADATADPRDELFARGTGRRMGHRRHQHFGEVDHAARAKRSHRKRLTRVRESLTFASWNR